MAGPGNTSSILSTTTLPEFTDLVRRNWVAVQQTLPRNARSMFVVDNIGSGQGSSKNYTEFDTDTYAADKPEGAALSKAQTGVGYSKVMNSRTFGKQIDITIEERVQNRYPEVEAKLRSLNGYCENREDLDLTHRLTFAASVSYVDMNGETVDLTVGDGLALASAVHTLAFSATTYTNIVSGAPAFSQTGFQAALLLASTQILNNYGQRRDMDFNVIWTGRDPATVQAVDQLLESMADVDAVQAGIVNTYKGTKRHIVLPSLDSTATGAYDSTKRRWWGIAAVGQGLMGWQAILGEWMPTMLLTPDNGNAGLQWDTLNWVYGVAQMRGIVVVSPRGFIISMPAS